jgi:hypothetical protein
MTTNDSNATGMRRMPAAAPVARHESGVGDVAYRWHAIPCSTGAQVFSDTTKLPTRRLSEASP